MAAGSYRPAVFLWVGSGGTRTPLGRAAEEGGAGTTEEGGAGTTAEGRAGTAAEPAQNKSRLN